MHQILPFYFLSKKFLIKKMNLCSILKIIKITAMKLKTLIFIFFNENNLNFNYKAIKDIYLLFYNFLYFNKTNNYSIVKLTKYFQIIFLDVH